MDDRNPLGNMENQTSLTTILEGLLFSANTPLSTGKMQSILKDEYNLSKKDIKTALKELEEQYQDPSRAFSLKEIAEGYLLQTKPALDGYLKKLHPPKQVKLAASALEVLAIIAYQQPIPRAEIEHIRGVDCSYSLTQLLERQLVCNHLKLEAPGNPSLFETTPDFLAYFGFKNLKDLPKLPQNDPETTNSNTREHPNDLSSLQEQLPPL